MHFATVRLNYVPHYGQSQAGSPGARREKRLKYFVFYFFRNALPVVCYLKTRPVLARFDCLPHCASVHCILTLDSFLPRNMTKNITLSANEQLIELARSRANKRHTTLNAEFRLWLEQYVGEDHEGKNRVHAYRRLMKSLTDAKPGRRFSRDEMNER